MDDEPTEGVEYEEMIKIAIEGEVVARLETKPAALISPMEDELMSKVLTATFSAETEENEDAAEAIEEYDPNVQLYLYDEGEAGWTEPRPASELNLDLS